jgi:hypothetical protein
MPTPGEPLFQAATANLNPWTEANGTTLSRGRSSTPSTSSRTTPA